MDESGMDALDSVYPDVLPIVFGVGSTNTRYGFGTYDAPNTTVPTRIQMNDGAPRDMDELQKLFQNLSEEHKMDPKGRYLLAIEPSTHPKKGREAQTQMFFEGLELGGFYLAAGETLSCYAAGRTSGAVVKVGGAITRTVAVYEGYLLPSGIVTLNTSGNHVTNLILQQIREQLGDLSENDAFLFAQEIKEKKSLVPEETSLFSIGGKMDFEYQGKKIQISPNALHAPDILFDSYLSSSLELQKKLFDLKLDRQNLFSKIPNDISSCISSFCPRSEDIGDQTLSSALTHTIKDSPLKITKELLNNIILSGGSTLVPGFKERLKSGMEKAMGGTGFAPKIVVSGAEQGHLSWAGGSILASLSTFQKMWISKEEYEESGPTIVLRKCF